MQRKIMKILQSRPDRKLYICRAFFLTLYYFKLLKIKMLIIFLKR